MGIDREQAERDQNEAQTPALTLTVTTREVVVDVVVTDHHDHPLLDLQQSDFDVFEVSEGGRKVAQRITAVRVVDPTTGGAHERTVAGGLHVTLGGGCAERSTAHYEVVYQVSADRRQSGNHQIVVTTKRRDAQLAFTPRYFVGETGVVAAEGLKEVQSKKEAEAALEFAACYHPMVPTSIPLRASMVQGGDANALVYQLVVGTESLPLISLTVDTRHVALEYAACTFDANGRPLEVLHGSTNRTLTMGEYSQAVVHGLPSRIDVPAADGPAAVRFVVRNRLNGNMGALLVETKASLPNGALTPEESKQKIEWERERLMPHGIDRSSFPPMGPKGSFGSVEPREEALCGDVYELDTGTLQLPNFWSLASVGSVYADVLDVPHQQFWSTGGVPGVTRKTDWFGIDYHGVFWVRVAGSYRFKLFADDGAKLYIDDALVIDADGTNNLIEGNGAVRLAVGWHSLHLPYFQGAPRSVALQLFVKPPDGQLQLFDVRDFSPHTENSTTEHGETMH